MKLSKLLPINGFIFLALGIGFTLYGPNVLAYFGVQDIPGLQVEVYWTIVGFARMFGAILITFGLVLTGLRSLFRRTPHELTAAPTVAGQPARVPPAVWRATTSAASGPAGTSSVNGSRRTA